MDKMLDFMSIIMSCAAALVTLMAFVMMSAKAGFLEMLSLNALRKGQGFRRKKRGRERYVIFDCVFRVIEVAFVLIVIIMIAPIVVMTYILLKIANEKDVFVSKEIIGRYGKCVKIYRFNSNVDKEHDSIALQKLKLTIRRMALDNLPLFGMVVAGRLRIFGLAKIDYSDYELVKNYHGDLLKQYDEWGPAFIDIYVFERIYSQENKSKSEKYNDICFTNSFFLKNRSFRLIGNMFAAAIVGIAK